MVPPTFFPKVRIVCDHCGGQRVDRVRMVSLDHGHKLRITAHCHGAVDEMVLSLDRSPLNLIAQLERQVGHAFTQPNPQPLMKGATP